MGSRGSSLPPSPCAGWRGARGAPAGEAPGCSTPWPHGNLRCCVPGVLDGVGSGGSSSPSSPCGPWHRATGILAGEDPVGATPWWCRNPLLRFRCAHGIRPVSKPVHDGQLDLRFDRGLIAAWIAAWIAAGSRLDRGLDRGPITTVAHTGGAGFTCHSPVSRCTGKVRKPRDGETAPDPRE